MLTFKTNSACKTLNRCQRLVEVRITTHQTVGQLPLHKIQVDEMTDELLGVFEMVRGVENVVFSQCFETKSRRGRTRGFGIAGSDEMRQRVGRIMTSKP